MSSSVFSVDQPSIQRGSERPGKERKQLLNQTSSSGFGDRESEASGEGSATPRRRARGAPASPGPAVSSLSPIPGPTLAAGSVLLAVPSAARPPLEPGSGGRSAETGRPKAPRAAPTPRNAGPGPGGRRGRARRGVPGWGPGLPSRLPLSPGSALRDEPPATPQSQRRDSGGWAPWRCPSSRGAPCPG